VAGDSFPLSVVSFAFRSAEGKRRLRDISDQISMIGRQEKAYTECTEDAEFAEKRDGNAEVGRRKERRDRDVRSWEPILR